MQINTLEKNTSNKKKKRVGRGGKRGTYSGRGIKGQKARAGHKIRPQIRDIIKKIPKHRGYKFSPVSMKPASINVSKLEIFNDGDEISPKLLIEKNIINIKGNKIPKVKILGNGEITKKVNVLGCDGSAQAIEKIEKAGGSFNNIKKK